MTTYLILNVLFFITLLMFLPKKASMPSKAWWLTLSGVLILTAIFDPLIVHFNIVDYAPTKMLGISFFGAPIEDFFYAVYAVCIVPLVWNYLDEKEEASRAKNS